MFIRAYFEEKEKKSKAMAAVAVIGAVVATVGAAVVVCKAIKSKMKITPERPRVLGRIDMNGDGELDATMLDTTGDGEVDTIVIDD